MDEEVENGSAGDGSHVQSDVPEVTQVGISEIPTPSQVGRQFTATMHIGPIPDPHTFGEYDRVLPGTSNRLLTIFESEVAHRHAVDMRKLDIEERAVKTHGFSARAGMLLAALMILTPVGLTLFFAIRGEKIEAIGSFLFALGVILWGKHFKPTKPE